MNTAPPPTIDDRLTQAAEKVELLDQAVIKAQQVLDELQDRHVNAVEEYHALLEEAETL